MKKLIFTSAITLLLLPLGQGQNIGISTTGAPAKASALLNVNATNLGLLTPRVPLAPVKICGTMENLEILKALDPSLEKRMESNELILQQAIKDMSERTPSEKQQSPIPKGWIPTTNAVITIPVVVHVLWNTASENITDAQVISQIDVLNKDYSRTNLDTSLIPAPWKNIATNTGIQFCLAKIDPLGNPTNGIIRKQSSNTVFNKTNASPKSNATGGDNAWDTYKYFNIWVCDLGGTLLGYAEFSNSTKSNTFGAVIHYQTFGTTGNVWSSYKQGRSATHEIGHCWNLRHTWGDDGGACTGSDFCADTPNQANYCNKANPAFPELDACATASPGYMFCNYMDYSLDKDKYMFTKDQSDRMNLSITSFYPSLITSTACQPSGTSVNNISAELPVSIYPNPTSGKIQVAVSSSSSSQYKIEIYNLLGEKVHSTLINLAGNTSNGVNNHSSIINLDVSKGIYFYQISSENNSISTGKLIIQ